MQAKDKAGVVVTGAAGDLGHALCESFVGDGSTVFAADIAQIPPRAGVVPVALDVTDREAVFALAERAAAEAGSLSVWINCAGIFQVVEVASADPDAWHRILAINLTGTYHGCAAALEVMGRGGSGGRIVNVGSISGQIGGRGVHPAYGASKAGVHALTKTYALEGAKHGIYCNAVAPAVLEGRMGEILDEKQRAQLLRGHPLGRFGRIEEVVHAVRYLADTHAGYTTGVILSVNGGVYMP